MAALIERRRSAAARWSRRLAAFAAMLFFVAGLGHRFDFVAAGDFVAVLAVVFVVAMMALACSALGFWRLWSRGDEAGRASAFGGLVALAVLSPFAVAAALWFLRPALTDISTDLVDPPSLSRAAAARTAGENPVRRVTPDEAAAQRRAYPTVTGRRYESAPDRIVGLTLARMADEGWTVWPSAPMEDGMVEITFEAVAHTLVFRFAADVAVRITDEGATTYVDMRSASRFGRHDFGDNARRIESFLTGLDDAVRNQLLDQTGGQPGE